MSDTYVEFSHWLEFQICESQITYQELVTRTGFTDSSIHRWFSGKNLPKLSHLIILCEVFGVCQSRPPQQLVFEALMNIPDMVMAQTRWKKKNGTV